MSHTVDPVELTARLIRCPSVTPDEGGALALMEDLLSAGGFACTRVDRGGVANLYARWGNEGPVFGFNGHTDVVPVGDPADWTHGPFDADIEDGVLFGRGATDMKSAVAAFAAAAIGFVQERAPDGSIVLALTGDEEGPSLDGTRALLDWMGEKGERLDVCLVGEPTCPDRMGEMIKIGRRGSMNVRLTATGQQGHSAYPKRARNPVPALARLVDRLATATIDTGTAHFDPSTLAVTTFDTGNTATNVIPATCHAGLNIRFNDLHSGDTLTEWLRKEAEAVTDETGIDIALDVRVSGEAFLTPPGRLSNLVARAVEAELGVTPELSTTGGTSDARFIKEHCPVVEFGLVGRTMHAVDERVEIDQIRQLTAVYHRILRDYFA
ncbi:succinyldiaminopimelate desuccinylase [Tranquillimonas rosea]|uniref:Succinyl-diaminopimelate desuccinylase n=1 Tax=Tranquillimonas rosea TaxID=641238 RepID=A0A1H9U8S1_9RHOB|nr:succinyl-diaminopimelate desuccinylase [Tranquillimonas rosea]SES05544.1 succinyldiaminopimelate desuccinylase [Tranquillimonas rosea]